MYLCKHNFCFHGHTDVSVLKEIKLKKARLSMFVKCTIYYYHCPSNLFWLFKFTRILPRVSPLVVVLKLKVRPSLRVCVRLIFLCFLLQGVWCQWDWSPVFLVPHFMTHLGIFRSSKKSSIPNNIWPYDIEVAFNQTTYWLNFWNELFYSKYIVF